METPTGSVRRPRARRALRWFTLYLVLLALSHAIVAQRTERPEPLDEGERSAWIPMTDDEGVVRGRSIELTYLHWPSAEPVGGGGGGEPIVLLHGSPGSASNFDKLGPILAESGRDVYAIDLPGFGSSADGQKLPSYSILAHARAVSLWLNRVGVERCHLLGWSLGGGVVLHVADMLGPERVASLTLLASVGEQDSEGSRSYFIEHVKYAIYYAAVVGVPELVPHFGLLGGREARLARVAAARNFFDTDQRPLRAVMQRLTVPTLIIHGRFDPLIPAWAAERHHELIRPSSLVMTPYSHFMPFLQPEETAGYMAPFLSRHDAPGVREVRTATDLAPVEPPLGLAVSRAVSRLVDLPWWFVLGVLMLAALGSEKWTISLGAMLAAPFYVDFFLVCTALIAASWWRTVARAWRARTVGPEDRFPVFDWRRRAARAPLATWFVAALRPDLRDEARAAAGISRAPIAAVGAHMLGDLVRIPLIFLAAYILAPLAARSPVYPLGLVSVAAGLAAGVFAPWLVERLLTQPGRRMLRAAFGRWSRHEFWPSWLFYAPLVPYLMYLAARTRHPLAFTACNPGIGAGGGVVGESKHDTLVAMSRVDPDIAPAVYIDAGDQPEARAARTLEAIATSDAFRGGYPVILKPDDGYRGYSVRLARSDDDVRAYFRLMTRPVVVQRYCPGPLEVGVLWTRDPGRKDGLAGSVFSVTRKEFPVLVGDGRRTLEDLILRHPRFRFQAATFLARLADQRTRIPSAGERIRLAFAGNHCQGTLFRDGGDLITPELERRIDRIAREFKAELHTPLDFGRFDIRYTSDDDLRMGLGFSVIELNGTLGESTNIYDPGRSVLWAYRVLFAQWRRLYVLGARRRRDGGRPMGVATLLAALARHYFRRPGTALAD